MIHRWLVVLGLWLARRGGWVAPFSVVLPAPPLVAEALLVSARRLYSEIERQAFHNGEQKRHAALRAMLNLHPEAKERDLGLAIELAVHEQSSREP